MLGGKKTLQLVNTGHMTCNIQTEHFSSQLGSYAMLKCVYSIGSKCPTATAPLLLYFPCYLDSRHASLDRKIHKTLHVLKNFWLATH